MNICIGALPTILKSINYYKGKEQLFDSIFNRIAITFQKLSAQPAVAADFAFGRVARLRRASVNRCKMGA